MSLSLVTKGFITTNNINNITNINCPEISMIMESTEIDVTFDNEYEITVQIEGDIVC